MEREVSITGALAPFSYKSILSDIRGSNIIENW